MLFGCNENRDIQSPDEVLQSPNITKTFISEKHEKVYSDYVKGKMSIDQVLQTFGVDRSSFPGLKTDNAFHDLLNGKLDVTEYVADKSVLQQLTSNKPNLGIRKRYIPPAPKPSPPPSPPPAPLRKSITFAVHYRGNCWWPLNGSKVYLSNTAKADVYIVGGGDRAQPSYPYYSGYYHTKKLKNPRAYGYNIRGRWIVNPTLNITVYEGFIPYTFKYTLPGRWFYYRGIDGRERNPILKLDIHVYAWFKFFWTQYDVRMHVTE